MGAPSGTGGKPSMSSSAPKWFESVYTYGAKINEY
jgi:hypothetical protein